MEINTKQSSLLSSLQSILAPDAILTGDAVHERSSGIWGPSGTLAADILVRPASTDEVSRILATCHEYHQPVVVHGGLTGVVEGAKAHKGDLILSLERLSGVEAIDPLGATLTAGAGTTLEVIQKAALEHGLTFPLDIGARGSATIGGNAATNAGGNRVIRYGMARGLILGLEAVLADGTVLTQLNQMLKNNAGYDLKHLFIGTEGTLGVITRVVVQLVPEPNSRDTALVAVNDFEQVCGLLNHMKQALGGTLSAFEVMWQDFYDYIAPSQSPPLDRGSPFYVLIEALGSDPAPDALRFTDALISARQFSLIKEAVVAKSGPEQEVLWQIRDDVVRLLELKPMFLFDVSLPISDVETYVSGIRAELSKVWPDNQMFVFGHLGDGNIHLAISAGPDNGAAKMAVEEIVYRPLSEVGGSISAEHGIGLEKKPYLDWCRTPAEIELMKTLKRSLDSRRILNPGKVFDLD